MQLFGEITDLQLQLYPAPRYHPQRPDHVRGLKQRAGNIAIGLILRPGGDIKQPDDRVLIRA